MQKSQEARLNALRRIQLFLDSNVDALGDVSRSTSRTDLDAAVRALEKDTAQQAQLQMEATSRTKMKEAIRQDLRLQHMQPVAAIARKRFGKTPAIQDLRLPKRDTSDAALVARGTAMARAAAPYARLFVDQTLPADFVAQLQRSVQEILRAVDARDKVLLAAKAATKNVRDQLSVTSSDVRVLNALVVRRLKGNAGLLESWKSAKRVRIKPGVPQGTTAARPAPAAPAAPSIASVALTAKAA